MREKDVYEELAAHLSFLAEARELCIFITVVSMIS